MGFQFDIDFYGETAINRQLVGLERKAVDMRPAFRKVRRILWGVLEEQFDSEGVHGGSRWVALKSSTVKAKAKRGLDPRILHATGALRASLTGTTSNSSVRMGRGEMEFTTRLSYAGFHQHGGRVLPRRPIMNLTETDKRLIMKTLQRFLVEAAR